MLYKNNLIMWKDNKFMENMKSIKVMLGNIGIEYWKNGIFAQRTSILINPNDKNIEQQIRETVKRDKMEDYEWYHTDRNVFTYWADAKSTEKGINNLREQGYFFIVND